MKRLIQNLFFVLVCVLPFSSCSTSDNEPEQPESESLDISGVWLEYAYMSSGGYFVDISDTGYNVYYDFEKPNTFTRYEIDENGNRDITKQGTWTFDPKTNVAFVEEPRGWNLEIKFTVLPNEDGQETARLDIKGRTENSSSIVKAKRISK